MNNTIKIGQRHFQWVITPYHWLGYMECAISNTIDAEEQLIIIVEGKDPKVFNPQNIRLWISFALNHAWYKEKRVYRVNKQDSQLNVILLTHSLSEEQTLVLGIQKYFTKQSLIEQSEISYQFKLLESDLGFPLPTLLKFLYWHLGNGNFGPDYGFYRLHEEANDKKLTLLEAYDQLHEEAIKDWDWILPNTYLPILYWGNEIYTLIDVSTAEAPVYVLDTNLKTADNLWKDCLWQHCPSLYEWLEKWQQGDETGRNLWLEMYKLKGLL